MLADAMEAQGKYKSAYEAKLKEVALADSLFQMETQATMGEMREKYQREKNQAEIQSLKDQAEIDALKRNGLWIGLIGVLILSLIILNREIQRRKKAKALHESQLEVQGLEKLRLEEQIQTKNRELSNKALTIAKKNELLHKLQNDLQTMMDEAGSKDCVRQVVNTLRIETAIEGEWDNEDLLDWNNESNETWLWGPNNTIPFSRVSAMWTTSEMNGDCFDAEISYDDMWMADGNGDELVLWGISEFDWQGDPVDTDEFVVENNCNGMDGILPFGKISAACRMEKPNLIKEIYFNEDGTQFTMQTLSEGIFTTLENFYR